MARNAEWGGYYGCGANLPPSPGIKQECKWGLDPDGHWNSNCGETWTFSGHFGPKDNGMNHCPFCGKALTEEEQ